MTSDVIATGRKFWYQFAIGEKLILFNTFCFLSELVSNRVIVIENRQNIFQLQLQLQLWSFQACLYNWLFS